MAGFVLPFVLVVYLALKGGGYDQIIYGQVGIAVWWLVLVGAAVGLFPVSRIPRAGWFGLALLGAFALWTALGIGWSSSSERSVSELGRIATYAGIFALALVAQGADRLRRTMNAVGAGIAVVAILALLSRLHPAWFPTNETAQFLPLTRSRLNYPLNYWNGLAALIAVGIPLVLVAAHRARTVPMQGLAAAALPAMSLAALYTFSRGGAIEIAVALIVLFALHPRRLSLLPTTVVAAGGTAILVAAATQRDALEAGLTNAGAHSQGNEMLAMTLVVCAGVGLIQVAIALASRHKLTPRISVSRRQATVVLAAALVVAIAVAFSAGLPSYISDRWQDFQRPHSPNATGVQRFDSASGSGRYQAWRAAVDANSTDPLKGIGPGTYEYWWAQHGTIPSFIVNAHSLYLETFGELGIIGLVLIVSVVAAPLAVGIRKSMQARFDHGRAAQLAGAVAALAAFAVAAGIDWVWQLPVIPAAFLLLAAAVLAAGVRRPAIRAARSLVPRIALVVVALASLVATAIPLAGAESLRTSQDEVRSGNLAVALDDARTAHNIQPYSASASLQEALVLEAAGDLRGASAEAKQATNEASTDWRNWLVLSRLEAERGDAKASVEAYRRAKSLNPRSQLFAQ